MNINYLEEISFKPLKAYLSENGLKVKWLAEKTNQPVTRISGFIQGVSLPKTDILAKMAFVLKVPVSKIIGFNNIQEHRYFSEHKLPYMPPLDTVGELTYKPLWNFLDTYLDEHEGKTANDLFDKIEPPRKKTGVEENGIKKALESKYGENYMPKTRKRVTVGLPALTRTKLRNDRPLSIRTIYEICHYLGCTIDWVLSYK